MVNGVKMCCFWEKDVLCCTNLGKWVGCWVNLCNFGKLCTWLGFVGTICTILHHFEQTGYFECKVVPFFAKLGFVGNARHNLHNWVHLCKILSLCGKMCTNLEKIVLFAENRGYVVVFCTILSNSVLGNFG